MIKLSIGLVAALAFAASTAQACEWQNVTASAAPVEQPATTSQNQTLKPLPVVIEQAKADVAVVCPDGAVDCAPVNQ